MSEPTNPGKRPLVRLGIDHDGPPGLTGETRSVGFGPATAVVAERLGLAPGSDVVHRVDWYFADDVLVRFAITCIPAEIARDTPLLTQRNLGEGGLHAQFEKLGRVRRSPRGCPPSRKRVPQGVPVIEVLHTSVDAEKGPSEVTQLISRTGLDYDIPISSGRPARAQLNANSESTQRFSS